VSETKTKIMAERNQGTKLGHEFSNVGQGISDQARCSCGWIGASICDDPFFVHDEWCKHVMEVTHQGLQPCLPLVVAT
jgi:hypothetical protein